jgi:hypothetical protein
MNWLHHMLQRGLSEVDYRYRRANCLQPIGPILFVGRATYDGPALRFSDDTLLETGDDVGTLHFDNLRFSQLDASSANAAARGFAKLLLQSLSSLAEKACRDPAFPDFAVFQGVSWLPAHGTRIGFVTTPLPDGLRKRLLAAYFGLLIRAFAPALETRTSACPDPHFYWLTRKQLLGRYSGGRMPIGRGGIYPC